MERNRRSNWSNSDHFVWLGTHQELAAKKLFSNLKTMLYKIILTMMMMLVSSAVRVPVPPMLAQ